MRSLIRRHRLLTARQRLRRRRLWPGLRLGCVGVALLVAGCPGADSDPPIALAGGSATNSAVVPHGRTTGDGGLALLGPGYMVWESNRTGNWRIWTRRLDGSGLRQLSPKERGRQHCCPHISPDGGRVAYLSVVSGHRKYPEGGASGPLHLIAADGTADRVLVPEARNYFENRAVVWRRPGELIYIAGDGSTRLLMVETGESLLLVREGSGERGWLVDSTLKHAITGSPAFARYDRRTKRVAAGPQLGGCQPYFTHDGRWGFWTAGAGGPLHRIDLASREISTILEKNDSRMPDSYGYAYFPMFSHDSLLLTYAASQNQHDHFRSDYEVFVAETDPESLELLGLPVRVTHHPATDRFPDAFLEPLALGRHFGEAPFTVRLAANGPGGGWDWDFGDGSSSRAAVGEHTYSTPGRYLISARHGDERRLGQVVVRASRPPRPVEVSLPGNGRRVIVHFDETVRLDAATVQFASGRQIRRWSAGEDGRSLELELTEPLRGLDQLTVGGVVDRAQQPNKMATTTLDLEPPLWPSRRGGLVFLWETGDAANLIYDPEIGADRATSLRTAGSGRLDRHFRMTLDGGVFYAGEVAAELVRSAVQNTNSVSLEATLWPTGEPPSTAARIVALSNRKRGQNFRLLQRGRRLTFSLRTGNRGPNANPEVELGAIPPNRPSHVVVTYSPGRLVAYLNGEQILESDSVQGDFFHWKTHPLVFGGEWGGGGDWQGTLEGVAIYNRVLASEEVRENYERYRAKMESRSEVAVVTVRARLRALSRAPTLEEISPYREALVVYEYDVLELLEGELAARRIRVVHWAVLDGRVLPLMRAAIDDVVVLTLEPFSDNPQLASLYRSETLEAGADMPLLYAADPVLG